MKLDYQFLANQLNILRLAVQQEKENIGNWTMEDNLRRLAGLLDEAMGYAEYIQENKQSWKTDEDEFLIMKGRSDAQDNGS